MISITSCQSDDEITTDPPAEGLVKEMKSFMTGDIVLQTSATLNGVDKTLLPGGCPTKFTFTWKDDTTFEVRLLDFTVGAMPMLITFACDVKTMQLNTWEKDEYPGDGWIKFYGKDGSVVADDDGEIKTSVTGSNVQGYYNANTHQINFIINYNMMNVRSECFLQTVDKSKIDSFEEDFAQFEEDLKAYKEANGL